MTQNNSCDADQTTLEQFTEQSTTTEDSESNPPRIDYMNENKSNGPW